MANRVKPIVGFFFLSFSIQTIFFIISDIARLRHAKKYREKKKEKQPRPMTVQVSCSRERDTGLWGIKYGRQLFARSNGTKEPVESKEEKKREDKKKKLKPKQRERRVESCERCRHKMALVGLERAEKEKKREKNMIRGASRYRAHAHSPSSGAWCDSDCGNAPPRPGAAELPRDHRCQPRAA